MPELAYLNGEIMPIDQARVPVEDRGYQFGDAVYEYLASYKGRLFAMEAHLDRLENSLGGLSFPPISRDLVRNAIVATFSKAAIEPRGGVRANFTRGCSPQPCIPGPGATADRSHRATCPRATGNLCPRRN